MAEAAGTRIEGNLIGTDSSGSKAIPNGVGVLVAKGASDTTVGGTEADTRNVISGNVSYGVDSSDGRVVGNHIGLDATGTAPVPNGQAGVNAFAPIQGGGASAVQSTAPPLPEAPDDPLTGPGPGPGGPPGPGQSTPPPEGIPGLSPPDKPPPNPPCEVPKPKGLTLVKAKRA